MSDDDFDYFDGDELDGTPGWFVALVLLCLVIYFVGRWQGWWE